MTSDKEREVASWFGDGMFDADCRHWLVYMPAVGLGMDPKRKLTRVPVFPGLTRRPHALPGTFRILFGRPS
jgi:hypothetical protein